MAAFVVWVPILKTDGRPDAETIALVSDSRATHFWDESYTAGSLFKESLALPENIRAWDLYLLFGRGSAWEAKPPRPLYWQHQLGERVLALAPSLAPQAFLQRLRDLLTRSD